MLQVKKKKHNLNTNLKYSNGCKLNLSPKRQDSKKFFYL